MTNLRLAVRALLKTPAVSSMAVLSLALGIGATSAIMSLCNQVLVRPLPIPDAQRLVNLVAPGPKYGSQSSNEAGSGSAVLSYAMFRDLERIQQVFTGIAAHRLAGANIVVAQTKLHGDLMLVSGSYFPTLGIRPALGRLLGPDDDREPDGALVTVLSHGFWRDAMAGDPEVVGRPITVNGATLTVVGVAPPGFAGTTIGTDPKLFIPLTLKAPINPYGGRRANRRSYYLYVFARLLPGASIAQARASLEPQYRAIVNDVEVPLQQGMSDDVLARFRAKPLLMEPGSQGQSVIPERTRPALRLLAGVSALVMLIACANIANLLLVRSAARSGEIAVRVSIGASRRHLVSQLLTESSVLAVAGGAIGLLVARSTLDLIGSLLPMAAVAGLDWSVDRTALAVSAALTIGSGLLFGLAPALQGTRPDVLAALRGNAGQLSGTRASARIRTTLATAQIALSMTLLTAAGLFTKSLVNIGHIDLGMNVDRVVTFSVSPALNGYPPQRSHQVFARIEETIGAFPGVVSVAASEVGLLANNNWWGSFAFEGLQLPLDANTDSRVNGVGPAYFSTIGVPIVAGRDFAAADTLGAPKVAIVNEAFVKRFGLGSYVIGRRIGERGGVLDTEIIGIVGDAKYSEVKAESPTIAYRAYRQNSHPETVSFLVRTSSDADSVLTAIPRAIAAIDPTLPVEDLRTMRDQIRQNVYLDRLVGGLSAAFAVLATLLAAIGLYGVLAYAVSKRTREIGLRIALGAAPRRVLGMVMRQVGVMTAIGSVIGLIAAVWLADLVQSMLFQMKGADPVVFAGAIGTLTLVALSAGFAPALRAARVDPMRALKDE